MYDTFSLKSAEEAFADFAFECPACGARNRMLGCYIDKNSELHITCPYCRLQLVININFLFREEQL